MTENGMPNGTYSLDDHRPKHTSLALTEYSANPSPPSSTPGERAHKAGVPEDLLLPNGFPDVSLYELISFNRSRIQPTIYWV